MISEKSCQNMRLSMQFTIRDILIVFVIFATCMGMYGIYGIVLAVYLLVGIIVVYQNRTLIGLLIYITIGLMPYMVLWHNADPNFRQRHCRYRLEFIEESLELYDTNNGHFPPAVYVDAKTRTRHSWRVLSNEFRPGKSFKNYDFEEPWNGSKNKKLMKPDGEGYRCPLDWGDEEYGMTNYVAVIGNDTLWPENQACSINDIPDGAYKTILLIEWPQSDIPWIEPRDLTIEQVCAMVESEKSEIFAGHTVYNGFWYSADIGINALFADGKVRFLPVEFLRKNIKALLTRNGGEPIDFDELSPRLNWARIVAVIILVVSIICLLRRPRKNNPSNTAVLEQSQTIT
jgi:hypothetical protein